jgi:ubiquinone/menaquinone biosynthesis C-methylase UbiE
MTEKIERVIDHREVGALWDENAEAWTTLTRLGYDKYRDHINTPAFMEMLPDVSGLRGLDVGCGEGHNTQLVAQRGARLTALDISRRLVNYARGQEEREPLGITYLHASALEIPFAGGAFEFVMATMSMMDVPDQDRAIREVTRVLKPGGFFQFSILHPCFMTPRFKWILDETGRRVALECGDYFAVEQGKTEEWIFGSAPEELKERFEKFRIPRFFHTLSTWLNMLSSAGLTLEECAEPYASDDSIAIYPSLAATRVVACSLHLRCRKPSR